MKFEPGRGVGLLGSASIELLTFVAPAVAWYQNPTLVKPQGPLFVGIDRIPELVELGSLTGLAVIPGIVRLGGLGKNAEIDAFPRLKLFSPPW